MSPRLLGVLLAVSVALNAFAIAGGVAAWLRWQEVEQRVEARNQPRRDWRQALNTFPDQTQSRVRASLRQSALEARPDFEAAREARREAVTLAQSPVYDRAAVAALLEQSRASELRGRARLETDALTILEGLTPAERAAMSSLLNRRIKHPRPREDPAQGDRSVGEGSTADGPQAGATSSR